MRFLRIALACAALCCVAAPGAAAATPSPWSCTAVLASEGLRGDPGDLVATAAVVNATASVECERDVLRTPPIDHLSSFGGHITLEVYSNGALQCSTGARAFSSTSSALVMHADLPCIIPVTSPARRGTLEALVHWATLPPYVCCGNIRAPINTVRTYP